MQEQHCITCIPLPEASENLAGGLRVALRYIQCIEYEKDLATGFCS